MTHTNEIAFNTFSLIKKAFSFHDGALVLISAPSAWGASKIVQELTENVEIKSIIQPLMAFGTLTVLYILVSIFDFYTGLRASKKEQINAFGSSKDYVKSEKLWSSVWKFSGVMMVGSILSVFSLLFALTEMEKLNYTFLVAIIAFYFIVISFDIYSIGENQKRRYGNKPEFYNFIEQIAVVLRVGIINRIKRLINNEKR